MKKPVCFLLALMFLLSAVSLSSCVNTDDGNGTEPPLTDPDGFDPEKSALENAMAQFKDIASLEGKEFVILSPSPGQHFYYITGSEENEIYYEEPSSDPLPNAIYSRNRKLEDKLGITIKAQWGGSTDDINNIVTLNNAAGDTEFNAILTRLDNEMTYATDGQLYNIGDILSMNPKNRWWDENIVNTFTIYGNRLFVIAGDINYYDDYSVQAVLFNKPLMDELNLTYPYEAAREGKWTIDMMTEMAAVGKAEINGDDVLTPGVDRLGLADDMDCVLHFLYPYGLSMSTVNKKGEPEVVWANDINTAVVEKVCDIFNSDYVSTDTANNLSHFRKGKIVFYCSLLGSLPGLRDMEEDFGVVPMPKGDPEMDRYMAYMSNGWSTAVAIPSTLSVSEAYDTGMILECMSAASMDYVTPALYDQLLESKFIRDPESKEMLALVFDSKVYDWAGDLAWAKSLRSVYQTIRSNPSSFARMMAKIKNPVEAALEQLREGLMPKS